MKYILLAAVLACFSASAFALDGNEIVASVDKALSPNSYEAYRRVINEEPNGKRSEYVFFTVKKGRDKIALAYVEPASERGKTTLRLGDNMWLYIPSVNKPVRLSTGQSLTGGVFNNADLMKIDFSAEYESRIVEETETAYRLELNAKASSATYGRIEMLVDKASFLPVELSCISAGGKLIKTIRYSDIKDYGGGLRAPAVMETTGPLYPGYKSTIVLLSMRKRDFADEVFTLGYMAKVNGLRK